MKQITFLLVAIAALAGVVVITAPASLNADEAAAAIFVTKIPPGYRDWKVNLRRPRRRQPEQYWGRFGQRYSDQGLPRGEASVPGRRDHCCSTLRPRPVGGK